MAQAPSRCITHPERTAVARCKQCHKPLCQRCVMKKPGGIYCSEECFENAQSFQERVEIIDSHRKPRSSFKKLIERLIGPAVVVLILLYIFIVKNVRSADDFIKMIKGFIP